MDQISILAAFWGVVTLVLFLAVIKLCYRIEARSLPPGKTPRRWGYADIIGVSFNVGVARDTETQTLRRRMLMLLVLIVAGFIAVGIIAIARAGTGTV